MAHFGVIRALEQAGLRVAGVAGTSIGAAVGGALVAGAVEAYEERMLAMGRKDVLRLLDPGIPTSGLFGGARLEQLMRELCGERLIEELQLPFVAVAANLGTGEEVCLRHGDLVDAIRASGSIPGLFRPVRRDGHWLVDGALTSPIPLAAARALGPEPIVAVNLNGREPLALLEQDGEASVDDDEEDEEELPSEYGQQADSTGQAHASDLRGAVSRRLQRIRMSLRRPPSPSRPGILDSLNDSIQILCNQLSQAQVALDPPALYIEPHLGGVSMFDLHHTALMTAEGERATRETLGSAEGRALLEGCGLV